MKATFIPDKLTPLTAESVARAFRSALETITGKTPPNAQLAVLMAQSALETGRWRSIHCFNLGNVKAGPDYEWLYTSFRCNEVINGKVQWFDPPHPQCNFRAFTSIDTGALAHLRFLSGLKRYAGAWKAAEQGDPTAFVHALKLAGYFTADEKPYLRAVVSLFNEYMLLLSGEPRGAEPAAPPDEHELHQAALAAMATFDPLEAAREERQEQLKEP